MRIELRVQESSGSRFPARAYDPDEDDVRSILIDVCRAIGRRGEFLVSGFGQEKWPLDVQTDLAVFLEQLPEVLRAVHEGRDTSIDFYEQGIERSIDLSLSDGQYVAKCTSRTGWQPNPTVQRIEREDLEAMLLAVREMFMRAFAEVAPSLAGHPWVRSWLACLPEH